MRAARALSILFVLVAVAAPGAAGPPAGLIKLSKDMTNALGKIEGKLEADLQQLDEGYAKHVEGAELLIANITEIRQEVERARLLVALGGLWSQEGLRQPALFGLAAVTMAVDDVGVAQLEEIRALEASRARAMRSLIDLIKRIRGNQSEILAYLEDDSLAKRLGELNVDVIAASVAEAQRLRAALEGQIHREVDLEAEKQRVQASVQLLQTLAGLARVEP